MSLLERLVLHARTTSRFAVYKGRGRDVWDERGRVAHESLFDVVDGSYRCPATQQGYSPFTTWTRGQAWVLLGFAEQLEFLETVADGRARAPRGPGRGRGLHDGGGAGDRRALRADDAHGRHPVLGHRGPRPRPDARPPRPAGRPVERPRAGGRLGGADRRPGPAAPRAAPRAARGGGGRTAPLPGRASPSPARSSARPTSARTRPTRACCSTPSTTGRTAGTTSRPGARCPAASRASGATTTCASWRSTSSASPTARRTTPSSPPWRRREAGRPRHGRHARHRARNRAGPRGGRVRPRPLRRAGGGARSSPVLAELGGAGAAARYFRADIGERRRPRAARLRGARAASAGCTSSSTTPGSRRGSAWTCSRRGRTASSACCGSTSRARTSSPRASPGGCSSRSDADDGWSGCVVNVTSISATVASTNRGEYCVSKAGLAMASQLWAVRLAEVGIPVYEVRPGHHPHRHDGRGGREVRPPHRRGRSSPRAAGARPRTWAAWWPPSPAATRPTRRGR